LIAILDYGSGNLRSAERAFATAGKEVVVTSDRTVALEADGLVVPGVGAFAACMSGLNNVNGAAIVRERLAKERPTLGICIGMQIMFSYGTEHSEIAPHAGVGVWDGTVSQLTAPILPHMGWNSVEADSHSILFKGIEAESFYFVHSYAAKSAVGKMQAWSNHGERFLAAVEDGYMSATQFHPEKSGEAGLALIKNWVGSL
jgi:glutamine amidotransferase